MDSQASQSQVVGDVNVKDDEDICSICFEPLDEGPTQTLECNHTFHRSCMKVFRKKGVCQKCPMCRGALPPSQEVMLVDAFHKFKQIESRLAYGGPLTRRERRQMNEVVELWEEAAEDENSCEQYYMAVLYYKGCFLEQNYTKAAEWFTKSAEQGDFRAQYYLGSMYYMGFGVKLDIKKAIEWLKKSTEYGNIISSWIILGRIYYHGYGVRTNYKEAFKWYEKPAVDADNPEAQDVLGTMFLNGWGGVKKNYRTAYKWFKKGANNGDSNAQFNMGDMYHKGKYVKKNHVKAIRWFEKALEQGHENAKNTLNRIIAKQKKQTKTNVD